MSARENAEKLVSKLDNSNFDIRNDTIEKLTQLRDTEVVDYLISLLESKANKLVKESVCIALGKIGDKKATQALIENLENGYESVRYQATIALGKIADAKAVPSLIEVLKKQEDSLVRSEAAKALGMIGDPSAYKILITILRKEEDRFMKYHTVTSLGKIGNKKATKDLQKIAKESNDDRLVLRAMEALELIEKHNREIRLVAG